MTDRDRSLFRHRVDCYALALLGDAPVYEAAPQGITCGALAAYHVDRMSTRPDLAEHARRAEAIISGECGVSL